MTPRILLCAASVCSLFSVLGTGCSSQPTTASTSTTTTRRTDYYLEDAPRTGSYIRRRYPTGTAPEVDSNASTVRPSASSALSSAGQGTGVRGQ